MANGVPWCCPWQANLDHVFSAFHGLSHYIDHIVQQSKDCCVKFCQRSPLPGLSVYGLQETKNGCIASSKKAKKKGDSHCCAPLLQRKPSVVVSSSCHPSLCKNRSAGSVWWMRMGKPSLLSSILAISKSLKQQKLEIGLLKFWKDRSFKQQCSKRTSCPEWPFLFILILYGLSRIIVVIVTGSS